MGLLKYKNTNGEWVVATAVTQDSNDTIKHSPQSLTEQQKFQARFNIGLNDVVKYSEQFLVEEEKEQVQQNIGLNDVLRYSEQQLTEEQIAQVKENLELEENNDKIYNLQYSQSSIDGNGYTVLSGLPEIYDGMIITFVAKKSSMNDSIGELSINGQNYPLSFYYAGETPTVSGYWYSIDDVVTVVIKYEKNDWDENYRWKARVIGVLSREIPASKLSEGTIESRVSVSAWGQEPSLYLLRNSKLSISEESPSANGDILWIYE